MIIISNESIKDSIKIKVFMWNDKYEYVIDGVYTIGVYYLNRLSTDWGVLLACAKAAAALRCSSPDRRLIY